MCDSKSGHFTTVCFSFSVFLNSFSDFFQEIRSGLNCCSGFWILDSGFWNDFSMIQDSGPNFKNLNYSDSFRIQEFLNMRKLENIFDLCIKYLDGIGWNPMDSDRSHRTMFHLIRWNLICIRTFSVYL